MKANPHITGEQLERQMRCESGQAGNVITQPLSKPKIQKGSQVSALGCGPRPSAGPALLAVPLALGSAAHPSRCRTRAGSAWPQTASGQHH